MAFFTSTVNCANKPKQLFFRNDANFFTSTLNLAYISNRHGPLWNNATCQYINFAKTNQNCLFKCCSTICFVGNDIVLAINMLYHYNLIYIYITGCHTYVTTTFVCLLLSHKATIQAGTRTFDLQILRPMLCMYYQIYAGGPA